MAIVVNDKKRKGEKRLGVLYDEGKVRRRREWRGLKDTLYDYGRWLYLLSILARVIVKPRNVKAMFRYRWFANYLAVPHMLDKFTIGLRDEALRITHIAMDFVVKDVAQCIDMCALGRKRDDGRDDGLPDAKLHPARGADDVLGKPAQSAFGHALS